MEPQESPLEKEKHLQEPAMFFGVPAFGFQGAYIFSWSQFGSFFLSTRLPSVPERYVPCDPWPGVSGKVKFQNLTVRTTLEVKGSLQR